MDGTPTNFWQEETILETPNTDDLIQPPIAGEGKGEDEGDAMEDDVVEDLLVGDDKELLEDDLRQYQRVVSVNTIALLRMKPTHLF